MKRSGRAIAIVALSTGVAAMASITTMPAEWVMYLAPRDVPVRITSASGSIWAGQAIVNIGQRGFELTLPDPLSWKLRFDPLPHLVISHTWLSGPVAATPVWSGMNISGQTVTLPAGLLGTLDARIAAFGPGGQIAVSWPELRIGRTSRVAGSQVLNATWHQVSSALTPVNPLGSYRTTISLNENGGADILLGTVQGPLLIEGSGQLDKNLNLSLNATLRIEPGAEETTRSGLDALLTTVGPSRNGITSLRFP